MKKYQKIIKYCAIAFAIFIIYEIIFGIITLVTSIVGIEEYSSNVEEISTKKIPTNISKLDIDISVSNLKIEKSNKFEISANDNIKATRKNNTLYIEEKSKKILNRRKENDVTLFIPNNYVFENIELDTKAGKLEIDTLNVNNLELDLGAGNVEIDTLNVIDKAKINTGAGNFIVNHGIINNLDLNMGLGNINIKTKLLGNNIIERGVGTINLTLFGNPDDYKIDINKGIGSVKINGDKITESRIIGEGINTISIDEGVGTLEINYQD